LIGFLTPEQVSDRYARRISVRTLANWRCSGIGPRFTRTGGRILYPIDALKEWESRNTVSHTGQYRK